MAYRIVSSVLRRNNRFGYSIAALNRSKFSPPHGKLRLSTASTFERVANTVKNDPFVKLSLSLCALIVGGTLVMELYNRLKRKGSPTILMLPPGFAHYSVKRESSLIDLHNKVQKHRSKQTPPVLYVTGPPGSGKTELVRQFCNEYGSKKWLGLKTVPAVVVCLDATSPEVLQLSLSEVANRLGIQPVLTTQATFSAMLSHLTSNQLPWLLVVDHLTETTQSCLEELLEKCVPECTSSQCAGALLITTSLPMLPSSHNQQSLQVSQRLNEDEGLELLESVSGLQLMGECPLALKLLHNIQYHPMAIALAAATMKIYSSFSTLEEKNIVQTYQELLAQFVNSHSGTLDAAVALYCEAAAASDSRLRHTFDMLGSCDTKHSLPVSVIAHHLCCNVYAIPDEALAPPPLDPILAKLRPSVDTKNSYWSQIKSVLPFLHPDGPSDESIMKILAASQDEVSYLRDSPILLFRSARGCRGDFEFVSVHSVAAQQISDMFPNKTAQKLDEDHVKSEAMKFEQSTWLKKFRNFDGKKSLQKFHQTLPGVSSPGVLTEAQFQNSTPECVQAIGIQIPDPLVYFQYLHIVSHYHRVLTSLNSYLQWCKGEMESILMQQSLSPHLRAIKSFPLTSPADKLSAEISLVAIQSLSSSPEHRSAYVAEYTNLIAAQKRLLGAGNSVVACSMVDLANLHLSLNDASSAVEILQSALLLYKRIPSHLIQGQLALDMSHALSSMGLTYSQLGRKRESKVMYEQALATAQSVPPSGKVSMRQRRLVASLLVDVTHAYLALGDLAVSKKYCELASMMLQTVYPQGHMETVRLFNISSIVNALLGNREESTRLRTEALKMKAKLTPEH